MPIEIHDPTYEPPVQRTAFAPRPASLQGLRIGLVDNAKVNSDKLLLHIAAVLEQEHGARSHMIRRKRNPAVPVHAELIAEFRAGADVVVAGIGD